MTAETLDELHRLLSAVCDGTAAPEDHRRLEEVLRSDAECRRFYLRYLDLHAAVLGHPNPTGAAGGVRPSPARPARRRLWVTSVAVAASVAGLAVWLTDGFVTDSPSTIPEISASPQAGYVATLSGGGGCRWSTPPGLRPGDRLPAAEYVLAAGVAEVRLDGGAGLTIEGPARFKLDGRREMTVEAGRVLFQADEMSEPVRVRTPKSEYLNLGTRYVMAVRPDGDDLHVLDGQVRRLAPGVPEGASEITPAGAARRYQSDRGPGREIPIDRSVPHPPADAPPPPGGLLAFDRFDYPAGDAAGPDRAGGAGWTSAWIPHAGLPALGLDAGRRLPWPGAVGPGGAVHHRGGKTAMHRYLGTAVRLDDDGVYYLSFRFRRAAADPADVNQVMVVLRTWGLTAEQEILRRTSLKFAVTRADAVAAVHVDGGTTRTPLPLAADVTYLAVGKVLAGRVRPDQAFFRVYRPEDPIPGREPADWSVGSPAVDSDAVFDQVSVEFSGQAEMWLDDLRVGRDWAAVTRPDDAAGP